jgi:multiple sugar transport system substrate-binding protein
MMQIHLRSKESIMKHMRKLPLLAALGIGVLATSACSPLGGSGNDGDITLLTLDGGEDNLALEEIVDAFEAQNDGVHIEITYVPEDTYPTKLQTALLADAPDIAAPYGADTMLSFEPIDDLVFGANGLNPADYNSVLESFCGLGGKLYCLGTTVGNMGLFYNKAMFDAAGLPYPVSSEAMSFDDFAELAAQLTVDGPDSEKVWGGGADIIQAYLDPVHYLDETGRTVDVLNEGYLGTVETLAGMVQAGTFPSSGQTLSVGGSDDGLGLQTMFLEGKLAMFVGDNYAVDAIEATEIPYGLAPVPVVEGDEAWVPVWTNTFGIPLGSAHKDIAADFLAFMATEGQTIQAQYGQMPLLTSVAETWANTEGRQQLVEVSKLAHPGIFNPNIWAWNAPLIDAYKAALRGEPILPLHEDAQPKAQQANDTTWETFDQAVAAAAG